MQITEELKEKIIVGMQAVLGIIIIALSVKNSTKVQNEQMKKVMQKNAVHAGKMMRKKNKMEHKLTKQKYKVAIRKAKGR